MLLLHVLGNHIEAIEPDYYKSRKLKQILDMPLDVLGLELTYSAEAANLGSHEANRSELVVGWIGLDWIPRGRHVAVTDENKAGCIGLTAHHRTGGL